MRMDDLALLSDFAEIFLEFNNRKLSKSSLCTQGLTQKQQLIAQSLPASGGAIGDQGRKLRKGKQSLGMES